MLKDRGIIKWIPFDSVMPSNKIKKELSKPKLKIPNLSIDQYQQIEKNIKLSYQNNKKITIYYYHLNKIYKKTSLIKKLDLINKQLIFIDNYKIRFSQILYTKTIDFH